MWMTQVMCRNKTEERLEKNEDIRELKYLELSKRVERMAEELRENSVHHLRKETSMSKKFVLKSKGRMEESTGTIEKGTWE